MKPASEHAQDLTARDERFARVEEYLRQLVVSAPTVADRESLEEVIAHLATMRAGLRRARNMLGVMATDDWQRGTKCSFCFRVDSDCGPLMTGANVSICATCAQNATEFLRALHQ